MKFKQTGKPFVLSLVVGLMFLLTACPGPGTNTPPTANNDTYSATAGEVLRVSAADGVLSNDQGDDLTADVVTTSAGSLTLNDDGSFVYTPTGAAGTTDRFTYTATNSAGTSAAATVTITITGGTNPQPDTLTAVDDTYTTTLGGAPFTVAAPGILSNDTIVPAGATPTINVSQDDIEEGSTLVVGQDGSFTYTPPAGATEAYTDTFSYTLTAGGVTSASATVTINVNAAPVAGIGEYDVNFQSQTADTPEGYLADYGLPYGAQNGQTYGWVALDAGGAATSEPCNLSTNGATPPQGNGRDRNVGGVDQLFDTFMHMQGNDVLVRENSFAGVAQNCAWQIAVPAGTYSVSIALGDPQLQSAPPAPGAGEPGGPYPVYQVNVGGNVFPEPGYTPPNNFTNPNMVSSGDIAALFAIAGTGPNADQAPLTVTVGTDGILTIVPTGKNTKIAYVSISGQGEEDGE